MVAGDRERSRRHALREIACLAATGARRDDVVADRDPRPVIRDGERAQRSGQRRLVADDAIVAEREDPEGHDLFRQMRVGPFVWIALGEELERRTRVVDLVEVHVARPVEAVAPRHEHGERDEERHGDVAACWEASGAETAGEAPGRALRRCLRELPGSVRLEPRVLSRETPDEIRGRADHHEGDGDLARAAEERRFDDLGDPQIDVLLVAREREIERDRERNGERGVRRECAPPRDGERQRQREDRKEIALVRPGRQEIEGERGERAAGEEHRRVPSPPEGDRRREQPRDEQHASPQDERVVRFPEVEEDRPAVERVQRGEGIGLRRASHERDQLGDDPRGRESPERDAEGVAGDRARAKHLDRGTPARLLDEFEGGRGDDHHERDPELRFHENGACAEDAGEPPASRPRRKQRAQKRNRADRVDLSPVRSREDRTWLERPDRGGRDRGGASGGPPEQTRDQERDRDVGGDAERLYRETERLSIEERAQEPQDVEKAGRVVAEVPRLVEATGSDRREPLCPGLIGADIGGKALRAHDREPQDHAEGDGSGHEKLCAPLRAPDVLGHCQ